ncbi:MAG: hypothetical protein KAT71_03120 [Gammaproteobacteria bacterium]|nr:hypothetical protein [Gammaproteobacteria bacterium]
MADEEYKFREEEYDVVGMAEHEMPAEPETGAKTLDAEATASTRAKISLPKLPKLPINKRMLVVLGAVFVIFILYQFVKPKKSIDQFPTNSTAASAAQSQPSATKFAPSTIQSSALMPQSSIDDAKINKLQQQLAKSQQELAGMQKAVYNLNVAVQELSQAVKELAVQQRKVPSARKMRQHMPRISYHVRAVVPGRAWLESSSGAIITVRPGSNLGNYGTVTKIDDSRGIVKTDLGFVIKYGTNDI